MIGTEDSKNICNAKSVKLVTTVFIRGISEGIETDERDRKEETGEGDGTIRLWRMGLGTRYGGREREIRKRNGGREKGRGGTKTSM